MCSSRFKGISSTFQFHLPWRSTGTHPLNSARDGIQFTNHTPISTEFTKPDLSERSEPQQFLGGTLLEEFESTIDVNLLLESFATQFPGVDDAEDQQSNHTVVESTLQEECVDLKPLLSFDNSDELFINNFGKIESTFDVAARENYIVINTKIENQHENSNTNKNNNNNNNNNTDILSAAQSPSTADNMDEEFFIRTPYGIDATDGANIDSVQTLDFSFGDNFILDDNNTALNGGAAIASRDVVKEEIFYDTPDNSNGPIISLGTMNNDGKIFQLPKMDLSSIGIFQDDALHTPDIIDSIMEFEKFQIPTNNKENHLPKTVTLTNVIAEDIPSTSNSIASFINSEVSSPLSSISSPASSSKKSKKRRYDDDDSDEDFVDDENDKDYIPAEEEESIVKKPKRGRPPKRGKSISSDDYSQLEPQEARYREMRDRNNEASRRSRYKRKQKEMKVVDELSLEEERNVRLKAEVEELQKTVDRFRDSLMKVMLSKR